MKKRTKWIAGGGALVLFISVGFALASGPKAQAYVTDVVKRGDLAQTVEVTGVVKSIDEVHLSFNASGPVRAIGVKVGDGVKVGQVLASLKADDLAAAYSRAASEVAEAKANLALKQTGLSAEARVSAEANVTIPEAAVSAAESALVQTTVVAEASVASAENTLAQTKTQTAADVIATREDLVEAIRSLTAAVRQSLTDADTILGVENPLYNQSFRNELASEDVLLLPEAESVFETAAESRDGAEELVFVMDTESDASISAAYGAAYQAYEDSYQTLVMTGRVLNATPGNSEALTLDDLNTFKALIASSESALVSDGSALVNAKQEKSDADRAVSEDVASAEQDVVEAIAARDRDVAAAEATAVSRQADLARAEAQLAEDLAPARDVDLANYYAIVSAAEADARSALARLNNARIISPIAGTVTAIDLDLGESATVGEPVITVLSNGQNFEVDVDIPESDVAKVRVGQTALVTFDAFGDDLVFRASVATVDPAEKVIEGVVFYATKVVFDAEQDLTQVKPGMSVTVTIQTAERQGVLYALTRSVLEKDDAKFIRVPSDTSYTEQPVTVGLRADDGLIEITNGVNEGQTIIVSLQAK